MKIKFSLFILLIFSALIGRAQCVISFTYSHNDSSYQFINTSTPLDTPSATITWSVQGPGITYESNAISPSFILPVNGTYYITLQIYGLVTCGGYKVDTITVSGLSSSGTCAAAMSYYPTNGSQFQFIDSSSASDSIVNYKWYGYSLPDSFAQIQGWTQNTVMSIWAYNGCTLPYYVVTHVITTVSGCQSSVTDTIHSYCYTCHNIYQPTIQLHYDSIDMQYYLLDTEVQPISGLHYWQIQVGADSVVNSRDETPYLGAFDSLLMVCVTVYDTARYCSVSSCDTFNVRIGSPTGIAPIDGLSLLKTHVTSDSRLIINYTGILPANADIYDIEGRLLTSSQMADKVTILDLSRFTAGSYFLHVSSPAMRDISRRIVLER